MAYKDLQDFMGTLEFKLVITKNKEITTQNIGMHWHLY